MRSLDERKLGFEPMGVRVNRRSDEEGLSRRGNGGESEGKNALRGRTKKGKKATEDVK